MTARATANPTRTRERKMRRLTLQLHRQIIQGLKGYRFFLDDEQVDVLDEFHHDRVRLTGPSADLPTLFSDLTRTRVSEIARQFAKAIQGRRLHRFYRLGVPAVIESGILATSRGLCVRGLVFFSMAHGDFLVRFDVVGSTK